MKKKKIPGVVDSFVLVKKIFEGFHRWDNAPSKLYPEIAFLKERHRHLFHVDVLISVTHLDRQVEFFMVQKDIELAMKKLYGKQPFEFGSRSCEMIAVELGKRMAKDYEGLTRVGVSEDGENRAVVFLGL